VHKPIKKPKIIPEIKTKGVTVIDMHLALNKYPELLKNNLMSCIDFSENKLTALHSAFWNNGLFIHVDKDVEAELPVIFHPGHPYQLTNILIILEPGSKLIFTENIGSNKGVFNSENVEIIVKDNASVVFNSVQKLYPGSYHFTIKRAKLGKNASIRWLDFCLGSKLVRSEITTYLQKEGANAKNYGIFFGNSRQQFDLVTNSFHEAPYTNSEIITKGALNNKAKAIYRGLVKIHKNAHHSNGFQKEDTLLLSPDAEINPMPNLEIDNDEVKCSHGASIGRIDREKMFYLKSRGMDDKEATSLYVKGFFEELIQKMKIPKLRDNMHGLIEERMG